MTDDTEYYRILGVSTDASEREIEQAYRQLLREFYGTHPLQPNTEQRLTEITKAYAVLIDPESRAVYDERSGVISRGHRWHPGVHLGVDLGIAQVSIGIGHRDEVE